MKIIFLDLDGVLNSGEDMISRNLFKDRLISNDKHGQLFDERCVRYLAYIIKKTDAQIVISSSWRLAGLSQMQDLWKDRSLPGEVIDITPRSFINEDDESFMYDCRGEEIAAWLNQNEFDNIEEWVIIDDDSDMLEDQTFNFVKTDGRYGLDYPSTQRVLTILGKK